MVNFLLYLIALTALKLAAVFFYFTLTGSDVKIVFTIYVYE